MTKKAKIHGKKVLDITAQAELPSHLISKFKVKTQVEVSTTRADSEEIEINFDENDLVALKFTDNTEWIGHPEDIQEIYDEKTLEKRSFSEEDYVFEVQIVSAENERGIIKRAVLKMLSVFSPLEEISETVVLNLGIRYDQKVQPKPDLYSLDKDFRKLPFTNGPDSATYLLFLHGTLSNVTDAFTGLTENGSWSELISKYGNNILALEHYTLSVSPLQNALDFLNKCPNNCYLDIISHSRGGLIADILAKCDYNNREQQLVGFSKNELTIVEKDDSGAFKIMNEINEILKTKRIYIGKIVRVACPSSGTTILSKRIDHFFNLVLNAVSLAFGIRNPMYDIVKSFLMELISQKENPAILPGLNSMMPESLFQKMLNSADTSVASQLYNISGDAEVDGVSFNSLKVILTNLFYRGANDYVVDTYRMSHGFLRKDGYYNFLSQDKQTNHFNYFRNKNTALAVLDALKATKEDPPKIYTKQLYTSANRGVILDMLSMEGITYKPKELKRDAIIFIPGIMGSTLGVAGEDQWIQMRALNKGAIVSHLSPTATNVEASGIVKKFYSKLGDHLSTKYDVYSLEFDWRKSVTDAAIILKNRIEEILGANVGNLHVIAHSMGGLVARQCMIDHPNTWAKMKSDLTNKYVMLGTPWLGSYLIMEVLTGHSKRVKQLAAIDFKHDRKELLDVFWEYPGVLELLPVNDGKNRNFWEGKFWKDIESAAKVENMPDVSTHSASLQKFQTFHTNVSNFLKTLDNTDKKDFFNNVYYICGKDDETVFDYTFKNRFLSKTKNLVYLATSEGDGSVTWETGIPKQLKGSKNLYFSNTSHGDLANDPTLFEGIIDLLENGKTNKLATQPPVSRGGAKITEINEFSEPLINEDAVVNAVFGISTNEVKENTSQHVRVQVVNADLKDSKYPVLVGHFYMDLILSAEKSLDKYLDNRLSDRLDIGYYPGSIGESEVFFNLKTNPKGAIVCGLGSTDELTTFLLAKTVKMGVLKYAMFMRDNYTLPDAKKYAKGISCMLIGIGYGKLAIEDSLKGILLGIAEANEYILDEGSTLDLTAIEEVEIVNYYESIASQAYYSIGGLRKADNRINIQLDPTIARRTGIKKKQLIADSTYKWWYNLHITSVLENKKEVVINKDETVQVLEVMKTVGFKYYSSIGLARIEEQMVGVGLHKIDYLLELHSKNPSWDPALSKTLFEMLIPNNFKNVFRNQGNIIIKIDKQSAHIPWEMLYDFSTDEVPVSVNSSFIRQMVTKDSSDLSRVSLGNDNVLIIGDPQYNNPDLPALPSAKLEAEWVDQQLKNNDYNTFALINSTTSSIIMQLYKEKYKMLHFAGHGLYDPKNDEVGIAIGNDMCIDPAMINQLGYVPEFVFINCCYSGAMNAKDEAYSRGRFQLAANIGTQLIDMGVKAIIISGWAVNDGAAKSFSETFYTSMFDGYDFGTSVQRARYACYSQHKGTNTWGAYQCYGNQYYKFKSRKKDREEEFEYVIASQVHTDLDNLLISIRDRKQSIDKTLEKLNYYLERALRANLVDAFVLEKEALIYDELGKWDTALVKYDELLRYPFGNYSIVALENFCTLKSYMYKEAQEVKRKVADELATITFITMAGENPNRLNIVANAHKFASLETNGRTAKIKYLKNAFTYYEKALKEAGGNRMGVDYLDALTNMIFISHFLELFEIEDASKAKNDKTKSVATVYDRLKESSVFKGMEDLEPYLKIFNIQLEKYENPNLDVATIIGIAEARYSLKLLEQNFDPKPTYEVLEQLKEAFKKRYSPRSIKIELKQIEYLQYYFTTNQRVSLQLKEIEEEINKIRSN